MKNEKILNESDVIMTLSKLWQKINIFTIVSIFIFGFLICILEVVCGIRKINIGFLMFIPLTCLIGIAFALLTFKEKLVERLNYVDNRCSEFGIGHKDIENSNNYNKTHSNLKDKYGNINTSVNLNKNTSCDANKRNLRTNSYYWKDIVKYKDTYIFIKGPISFDVPEEYKKAIEENYLGDNYDEIINNLNRLEIFKYTPGVDYLYDLDPYLNFIRETLNIPEDEEIETYMMDNIDIDGFEQKWIPECGGYINEVPV